LLAFNHFVLFYYLCTVYTQKEDKKTTWTCEPWPRSRG